MIIEHVAIWANDLESMHAFYTEKLGGVSGGLYENPSTGFRSYFVSLGTGARLELMHQPDLTPRSAQTAGGYAHLALSLGSREAVDDSLATLRSKGIVIASEARVTGDGYYEAVILDTEGNLIELTE